MTKVMPVESLGSTPDWPTMIRSRLTDGRMLGVDNSLWLYRAVPMAPVAEARTPEEGVVTAEPLMLAFEEIAAMTPVRLARRASSRSAYRQFHLLLVNLPQRYVPPTDHPIADYLATSYPNTVTDRRVLLLGVRLQAKVGGEGGLKRAIDSVAETLTMGGTPLSDYEPDYRDVAAGLARAGLTVPTQDDLRLASAWWNEGNAPDVPMLAQPNCLHVFTTMEAARAAKRAGPDSDLAHLGPGHHTLTFAAVSDLDLPFVSPADARAQWATQLVDMGALAVSVRGKVEPTQVTRAELRRNRKRYQDDINERVAAGKMERAEQSEHEGMLADVEAVYAQGGPPTLVETSVVVGFNGLVPDMAELSRGATAHLLPMMYRQRSAMVETMLCSPVRANPHLQDLPTQSVAASGLPSLSTVGDRGGALVGFTESDRQPALIDPMAAAHADTLPLMVCVGQTGSGKLLALDTPVPTPSGTSTIGQLQVGDEVIGRDGRPCTVTYLSPVDPSPDLYRVTLSDGQQILADSNHQWVVSSHWQRNGVKHPNRQAAADAHARAMDAADRLDVLVGEYGPDDELTARELTRVVAERAPGSPWRGKEGVVASLRMLDVPYLMRTAEMPVTRRVRNVTKTDPVLVFPVKATCTALADRWESTTGGNASRWGEVSRARACAARQVATSADAGDEETAPEIARRIAQAGGAAPDPSVVRRWAREAGIEPARTRRQVHLPLPAVGVTHRPVAHYPAAVALKALAERLRQRYRDTPVLEVGESVMSTGEMLDAGVRAAGGRSRFAIRVSEPLEGATVDLPVPPYTLGAWLGDGSASGGGFTGVDPEIIDAIVADGFEVTHSKTLRQAHYITGLVGGLRTLGVLNNKHIPTPYLRASVEQRLAVLQGLMDTDGTIGVGGGCELALCDERLATDALELVRSLGIKASMTSGPAAITEPDPQRPGRTRRRLTGTRYRIKFTTDQPVFRLPRKAARLPQRLRETHRWLYITSVEPVAPVPGRCLTVDSRDSTYLAGGFVPTHNTMAMLWLADQLARIPTALGEPTPTVIIDPKPESDHTAAVLASGGQVASLDDLASADGIFDPIRFSTKPEVGVELAASMLMSINPWGSKRDDFETPLQYALHYGVSQGATCVGQALRRAKDDGQAPPEMVDAAFRLASSSSMFRAIFGINPSTDGLRVASGITLIKVGSANLDLPEPGAVAPSLPQRVALALVRMMVFGSAMALTDRDGVILLDEAWVFMSAGRAEMERLGRLARSQRVFPMLFTQRVTDALDAGLRGYISRGLIGAITDRDEAVAACELFKLAPTDERLARITASETIGAGAGTAPNWNSMRALIDPVNRQVHRGSVWIYCDISNRAVPVEVTIPPEFLARASTNAAEIRQRVREAAPVAAPPVVFPDAPIAPPAPSGWGSAPQG